MNTSCLFKILFLLIFLNPGVLLASEKQLVAAVHVHSNISKGKSSLEQITEIARKQKIDAVVLTDLFRERYGYGLWPLRGVIKHEMKRHSASEFGLDKYLEKISRVNRSQSEVLIMDGVALTPFYYWTGNVWPGPLTLNGRAKDMLVMGFGDSEKYKKLPIVDSRYSDYTSYDGNKREKPFQEVIDYVNANDGLIFWSHPSAHEKASITMGPLKTKVQLRSRSYFDSLKTTERYVGFGVLPAEVVQMHKVLQETISPGETWDQLLKSYCRGEREKPVWVIGEVDFVDSIGLGEKLGSLLNAFIYHKKSEEAIFEMFKLGQSYVVAPFRDTNERVVIEDFSLTDPQTGVRAQMGGELSSRGPVQINIRLAMDQGAGRSLTLDLIRNGKRVKSWEGVLPFEASWMDENVSTNQKVFYRIAAFNKMGGKLLSNPIFAQFEKLEK